MVSWDDAMEFADAVAHASGWVDEKGNDDWVDEEGNDDE
jgi:hypothetical protein